MGEADLEDVVLSWSLQEINDDDLYRGKVRAVVLSVRHSFTPPLARLRNPDDDDLCGLHPFIG